MPTPIANTAKTQSLGITKPIVKPEVGKPDPSWQIPMDGYRPVKIKK